MGRPLAMGFHGEHTLALKPAKVLGFTVPPSLLGRVDEIIQ